MPALSPQYFTVITIFFHGIATLKEPGNCSICPAPHNRDVRISYNPEFQALITKCLVFTVGHHSERQPGHSASEWKSKNCPCPLVLLWLGWNSHSASSACSCSFYSSTSSRCGSQKCRGPWSCPGSVPAGACFGTSYHSGWEKCRKETRREIKTP